jgi:hypothetical protein
MLEAVRHITDLSPFFLFMPYENGTFSFANFMGPALNMNSIEGVLSSGVQRKRKKRQKESLYVHISCIKSSLFKEFSP